VRLGGIAAGVFFCPPGAKNRQIKLSAGRWEVRYQSLAGS
jgi:hypothetical protein